VYRDAPAAGALLRSLAHAAGSGRVLLIALMNFTVVAVVVGILTWTPEFFHDQFGTSFAVAAYLTAAIGVSQTVGNPLGALAMKRWSKPAVLVVGLALTAVATALVPAVASATIAFVAVLVTVLLAGAVLPPSLAVVGDVAHGNQAMGAATGLIGLFNVVGSMVAPWAFGALLDAYGTAPGDSGYTAGYLMLAGFCAVGALGAIVFVFLLRRAPR
jgi:predicted MFS family arabinose efflux permease